MLLSAVALLAPDVSSANGWYESKSWQFDTSSDKANKSAVADMIARKKGGYYDSFSPTNYYNTNIGTQFNCNNAAGATGNESANNQLANSPDVDNTSGVTSTAAANESSSTINGPDKPPGGSGIANDLGNSGDVTSNVTGSKSQSASGAINSGVSDQALRNQQENTGSQKASVSGTACDMTGSVIKDGVRSNITGPLN